MINVIRIC